MDLKNDNLKKIKINQYKQNKKNIQNIKVIK